jgi:Raf kinase inhibitor-like YbhB/YbcL family protein
MSFALLMDDPTVRGENGKLETFNHWVVFDLPASTLRLHGHQPRVEVLDNGALQGKNGNDVIGYLGPRPPRGEEHTYLFRVFALNTPQLTQGPGSQIPLPAGATKDELVLAMADHVIGIASLRGTFNTLTARF